MLFDDFGVVLYHRVLLAFPTRALRRKACERVILCLRLSTAKKVVPLASVDLGLRSVSRPSHCVEPVGNVKVWHRNPTTTL